MSFKWFVGIAYTIFLVSQILSEVDSFDQDRRIESMQAQIATLSERVDALQVGKAHAEFIIHTIRPKRGLIRKASE